jgi:aerotaxis receptor
MRMNMPITQVEHNLADGEFIVSKTNLKGQITYLNRPFIEISGFSADELLGQPHNIVRHPDMPSAAYKDLWNTLQKGKSWRGIVKNRCKNGDYYWVEANANPIWENDRIVGYMSLRSKPTRQQIDMAETLYRKFHNGTAHGLTIKEGQVMRTGIFGWLAGLANISVGTCIMLSSILIAISVSGLLGIHLLELINEVALANKTAWLVTFTAVALTGLGWAWWLLHLKLIKPIEGAVRACQIIAAGEKSTIQSMDYRDETGRLMHAIHTMYGNIASIVSDVRNTTEIINAAAHEIAQGNSDLSKRTEEQASSLEETSSSMEELTSTVKQNAENAKHANQLSLNASDIAVKGGKVVGDVVQTMASISASSKKIVDIISVIEGIAFQTNILALNAAVEAARAGEQGRGFAVVAGEVRNLAQRSAAAAKEIKNLIDDSVGKVDIGAKQVDQAGTTMKEIIAAVKRVTDIMAEIAAASNEQRAGIDQVNTAITQIDEVTQQNAALVEEAAAATESMEEQAKALMRAVSIFKLDGGRKVRTAAKPPTRHSVAHRVAAAPARSIRKRKLVKAQEDKDRDRKSVV